MHYRDDGSASLGEIAQCAPGQTAASDLGIGRVVFASSGSIYGRHADFDGQPVNELSETRPRILYAKMKQLNEWLADHVGETTLEQPPR